MILLKRLLMVFLILISTFIGINVRALENINLHSPNYIVYDMSDEKIVLQNNVDVVTPMASLTKIMTTIVAIENSPDLDKKVIYSKSMRSDIDFDASLSGLIENQEYTVRDLLYATMLPSGADATNALAFAVSGSIESFVDLMNQKATSLGMTNTHYVNTHGLDRDNHYSSINDLFILLKYALKNQTFKDVYTTKSYNLSNTLDKYNKEEDPHLVQSTVAKTASKMGLDASRIIGSKTGYTDNAGKCISVLFNSNGHDYLAITTKASYPYKTNYHVEDAISIINYIDNNYNNQILVKSGTLIESINVNLSEIDKFDIVTKNDVTKYLSNDYDKSKVSIEYTGLKDISYNYDKSKPLGVIKYYYDGEVLKEEEVLLDKDLKLSIEKLVNKHKYLLILMGSLFILLIIIIIVIIKKHKRRK